MYGLACESRPYYFSWALGLMVEHRHNSIPCLLVLEISIVSRRCGFDSRSAHNLHRVPVCVFIVILVRKPIRGYANGTVSELRTKRYRGGIGRRVSKLDGIRLRVAMLKPL